MWLTLKQFSLHFSSERNFELKKVSKLPKIQFAFQFGTEL